MQIAAKKTTSKLGHFLEVKLGTRPDSKVLFGFGGNPAWAERKLRKALARVYGPKVARTCELVIE